MFVAVVWAVVGEVVVSYNFAVPHNVVIVEIVFVYYIVFVYNIMLVPDNVLVPVDTSLAAAVKLTSFYSATADFEVIDFVAVGFAAIDFMAVVPFMFEMHVSSSLSSQSYPYSILDKGLGYKNLGKCSLVKNKTVGRCPTPRKLLKKFDQNFGIYFYKVQFQIKSKSQSFGPPFLKVGGVWGSAPRF